MGNRNIPYITGENKLDNEGQPLGWARNRQGLKDLAAGLECQEQIDFNRSDISVPTPWALLVSFDIFLRKKDEQDKDFGVLKKSTVNEWRSLLTLIALKEYFGIDKKLDKKVILINPSRINDESVNEADKRFYNTIFDLHPTESIFGESSNAWDEFVILTLNNEPIGVYSPLTLVCSLYSYGNTFATEELVKLGLMDKNFKFVDPIDMLKDDLALSLYMVGWLSKLKGDCLKTANDDIKNSIDAFIEKIGEAYIKNVNPEKERIYNALAKESSTSKLFEFKTENDSESLTVYDMLNKIKLSKINLRIPELTEKIKIESREKSIYILDFLGMGRIRKLIDIFPDACEKDEGEYWDENDVFYEKMALVEAENGVCSIDKEINGRTVSIHYNYILPIKEKVLELIRANVVGDNTEVTLNDDRIRVEVKFKLDSGAEETLSKTYNKNECEQILKSALPTVAIWPYAVFYKEEDMNHENIWKDYYIFRAQLKSNEKARITYSIEAKCDMENTKLQYQNLTRINGESDTRGEIAHYDKIPTYLSVVKFENIDINGINKKEEKLGIFILPEDEKIEEEGISKNVEYVVGLDFGTTATTAFCKKINDAADSGEIKFVKFGQPITERKDDDMLCTDNSYQKGEIDGRFVGDDRDGCYMAYCNTDIKYEPETSFVGKKYPNHRAYSSVYKLNTDVNVMEGNKSLKYGNVIYDQTVLGGLIGKKNSGIIPDLKWGGSDNGDESRSRIALKGFLNQIMKTITLALCKERAGKISWRFSYPTALSENRYEEYKKITEEINQDIKNVTGIDSSIEGYYPESIASARYFSSKGAQQYISIDIGGGSTDVSLWRKDSNKDNELENIMQFSIGIASRKIFLAGLTDAIVNPNKIMEKRENYSHNKMQESIDKILTMFSPHTNEMNGKLGEVIENVKNANNLRNIKDDMSDFAHIIELLLQLNDEQLESCIENSTDDSSIEQKKRFETILVMGLWGILYYTAKSITELGFKDKLTERYTIYVEFAGNGSKMYDWLPSQYKKGLEKAFESVLDHDKKFDVKFDFDNKELKTEAASGMLDLSTDKIKADEISNDGLVDLGAYTVKFKEKKFVDFNNSTIPKVPDEYRRYFNPNGEAIRPYEICPKDSEKDLAEYFEKLDEILGNHKIKKELEEKIKSTEFTGNIGDIFEENIKKGTVTPVFILELEALLRTYLGYKCE